MTLVLCALAAFGLHTASAATVAGNTVPHASEQARQRAVHAYGQLPIRFEENLGQTQQPVRYLSRGAGYSLFLTPTEAVIRLQASKKVVEPGLDQGNLLQDEAAAASESVVRLSFAGASDTPAMQGLERQESRSHYLVGPQADWKTGVQTYSRVRYSDLYPGIDLLYYGNQGQLEYDLVVAPGADPGRIALDIAGVRAMALDAEGNLVLDTSHGEIVQRKPILYQDIAGERRAVDGRYALLGKRRIGFEIGRYDAREPLVIDPILVYSTYLGGSAGDVGNDIALDSSNNAYLMGYTNSTNFPTKSGYKGTLTGSSSDLFVAKFGPTGNLLFSTFIGGTGTEEGSSIAVDSAGNAFLTGRTTSVDFPLVNAYQSQLGGLQDAFVTKLNASGTSLGYSTYLGGSINTTLPAGTSIADYGYAIAVDANGSAHVTGTTVATNFPVQNAFQPAFSPKPTGCDAATDANKCARSEAFVTKFSAAGNTLVYSTYLGGTEYEDAYSVAVDGSGNAYVTGRTFSNNFPLASAKQGTYGSNSDAFVTKISSSGALVFSTYLGGFTQDVGYGIAVDSSGAAIVAGVTNSPNFPTQGSLQIMNGSTASSSVDAFVTRYDSTGSAFAYSTYLGGSGNETGIGVALGSTGDAYVTGQTTSTNFPVSSALQTNAGGLTDAFLIRISSAGTAIIYSTYLGGAGDDYGTDVAVNSAGDAFISGYTFSTNFPTAAAHQSTSGGSSDAFLTRISSANDITISINDVRISEGNSGTSTAQFTVSLSKTSANAVTFSAATANSSAVAPGDFTAKSSTGLTIPANTLSSTFSVSIVGDTSFEADETFLVNLSAPVGAILGDAQGVGTITNDDTAVPSALSIGDISISEGNSGTSTATFTVSLSPAAATSVSYDIATANGTASAGSDYLASSLAGQVITAGTTTKTFAVTIYGDTTVEANETFTVNLSNASGASIADAQATGTINNDEVVVLPALTVGDVSVTEGNSGTVAAVFTVSLSKPAELPVSLTVVTTNQTAGAPGDFTALPITSISIPAGSSSTTVAVQVNGDTTVESNETFSLNAGSVNGATVADGQGTATILNDDVASLPNLSVSDVSVAEGNSGTSIASFTVSLSTFSGTAISFNIATAGNTATAGSDFVGIALNGESFAPGTTSKTYNVTINGDTTVETDETFTMNVTGVTGANLGKGTGTGTIRNDDNVPVVPPQLSVNDVTVTEGDNGNKTATFVVSLNKTSDAAVSFDVWTSNGTASSDSDYVEKSAAGAIPAGQTSYNFAVSINPDGDVEDHETFTVNLNNPVGATIADNQGRGLISNDDNAVVSISAGSHPEGNSGFSSATAIITLSKPMPTPVSINVTTINGTASSSSDYVARSSTLVIDAGRTRYNFAVRISGDTTVENNETLTVAITGVTGATLGTAEAVMTIVNDDAAAMKISEVQGSAQASPVEGGIVVTEGVVTAVNDQGLFLQSAESDQDGAAETAEGLFVSSASAKALVGERLRVSGRVHEARIGSGDSQLTLTTLAADSIEVLATGQSLPRAVALDGADLGGARGVAGLERYEGMRVSLAALDVVAPAGGLIDEVSGKARGDGRFHVVASGVARPFLEPGLSTLDSARAPAGVSPAVFDANPERLMVHSLGQRGARALSADTGDVVSGLVGVLSYGDGAYQVLPDPGAKVAISSGASPRAIDAPLAGQATIGSFNLRRFLDDARTADEAVPTASAYAIRLAKTANAICAYARNPDILGLAGIENGAALGDLAAAVNGRDGNVLFADSCSQDSAYRASTLPGSDARGRNLGFLVNTVEVRPGVPRVQVLSLRQLGAAKRFRQRDGSTIALNERAPLVLEARINGADGRSTTVTVVANHLSALDGDLAAEGSHGWKTQGEFLRARRAAQASFLAAWVQARQSANPAGKLVLLGDFGAAQFSDGHSDLLGLVSGRPSARNRVLGYLASPISQALSNMTLRLPAAERYTVTRQGNAEAVDHILVNAALLASSPKAGVQVARINADFAEDHFGEAGVPMRVSDHDPVVLGFDLH